MHLNFGNFSNYVNRLNELGGFDGFGKRKKRKAQRAEQQQLPPPPPPPPPPPTLEPGTTPSAESLVDFLNQGYIVYESSGYRNPIIHRQAKSNDFGLPQCGPGALAFSDFGQGGFPCLKSNPRRG
jgi:hypothetical protein